MLGVQVLVLRALLTPFLILRSTSLTREKRRIVEQVRLGRKEKKEKKSEEAIRNCPNPEGILGKVHNQSIMEKCIKKEYFFCTCAYGMYLYLL